MNELYAVVIIAGFINLAVLIVGIAIMNEFKDFKELCNIWISSQKLDQDMYKLLLEQYKTMRASYDRHYHIFELMTKQFEAINAQYKEIQELHGSYVQLCRDCVSQYSDSYEQFKLCSDKLDRIFPPQVSVSPEDFKADDEDISI